MVGSSASVTFEVTSAEYLPDLGMQRLVNFTVLCWVPSSEQSFIHVESKRLHIPDVDIQINGQGEFLAPIESVVDTNTCIVITISFLCIYIHVATNDQQAVQLPANQLATVTASFVNPLNTTMTNIQFYVEGSGLLYPQTLSTRHANISLFCYAGGSKEFACTQRMSTAFEHVYCVSTLSLGNQVDQFCSRFSHLCVVMVYNPAKPIFVRN